MTDKRTEKINITEYSRQSKNNKNLNVKDVINDHVKNNNNTKKGDD